MKTIAIDTNVVLDFLLKRQPRFKIAQKYFQDCLDGKIQLFFSCALFLEIEWVLRSFYKQPRAMITDFFDQFLALENGIIKDKKILEDSLLLYRGNNVALTDAMILIEAAFAGSDEFVTFDQKLQTLSRLLFPAK